MKHSGVHGKVLAASMRASKSLNRGSTEQFLRALAANGIIDESSAIKASDTIYNHYLKTIEKYPNVNDRNNNYWDLANKVVSREFKSVPEVSNLWNQYSSNIGAHTGDTTQTAGRSGASTSHLSQTLTTSDGKKIKVGKLRANVGSIFAHAKTPTPLLNRIMRSEEHTSELQSH
mgnify:CR=1 FL=1